ncbi:MAG: type II secretion system protein GspC [Polyangiaceae bacterium]
MNVDKWLKRYFVGVILGLLAVAAYLQAVGGSALIGSWLFGVDAAQLSALPPRAAKASARADARLASADPILARNAFDSVTGPLLGGGEEEPEPDDAARGISSPLEAPACDGILVSIVSESPDPLWSMAAIREANDPVPAMRRVGEQVGDRTIAYIGQNPLKKSPAVWLESGAELCQVALFERQASAAAGESPSEGPSSRGRGARLSRDTLPKEIADKIRKVSATEFEVDRSVVDRVLAEQSVLMGSVRIAPMGGKGAGIRMNGIRPDTLLGTLGFKDGDRLESINGFDLSSPEVALQAYARLRTADNLKLQLERGGGPVTIDIRIK